MKIRIGIDFDEWYPICEVGKIETDNEIRSYLHTTEIPEEKYNEYLRIEKEFDEMQKYLISLVPKYLKR